MKLEERLGGSKQVPIFNTYGTTPSSIPEYGKKQARLGKIRSLPIYLSIIAAACGSGTITGPTNVPNPDSNPNPTTKGALALDISAIHEPARNSSNINVYVDDVRAGGGPGPNIAVDNLSPGTHYIRLEGDKFEKREFDAKIVAGQTLNIGTTKMFDKNPGSTINFLERFNQVARTNNRVYGHAGDKATYADGTLVAEGGPKTYYIDLTSLQIISNVNGQLEVVERAIRVDAPKVYKRTGQGINIVYVCTGANPTNRPCDTTQMPQFGTNNAYLVVGDSKVDELGFGGIIQLYIRNGMPTNGGLADNVVTGGKFRWGRSACFCALDQEILNLLGLWNEYESTGQDSIFLQHDYSSSATRIDELLGKTLEEMGPGVTSPYNTRGHGPIAPQSFLMLPTTQQMEQLIGGGGLLAEPREIIKNAGPQYIKLGDKPYLHLTMPSR